MTDPERTLLDGLSMPHNCGDFSEVMNAFETRMDQLKLDRIAVFDEEIDDYRAATREERLNPSVAKHYLDPWNAPYRYRPNKDKRCRHRYMINRHSFDLWSRGPDGIDESSEGDIVGTDDIGNW